MAADNHQVRVGVGIFVLDSSKAPSHTRHILIGKRLGSHGSGTFALPGGHLEFGETFEECAAREVEEETGLKVDNVQFLTATNDYMPKEDKHYVTMMMVAVRRDENIEPQVLEPNKCACWEWITWDDLKLLAKREIEALDGEILEQNLFGPLLNLIQQRPDVTPIFSN